ncbi:MULTISPECIES: hypothetical protein [Rhodococcus]|nr:hypothetical protein [Rhodococcus pyridinivorans]MCD2118365.1 hypothetical protein [Rhodococcus pyridinivorans]MCZ4627208.1 hypothetical protein [Rhodococcus pyridinivorans]MCZ4648400.1 hypothetical protein [Rhodococcus pyridinivorans]MDJ0481165.1 hypothetical protein [Rhodococcus pyridinivorans]MDV7254631.1 hypothetical protein [Rhodococcus pyridinivorans]
MNKEEITAKLHNLGRDIDALLENISTGKDISVVLGVPVVMAQKTTKFA